MQDRSRRINVVVADEHAGLLKIISSFIAKNFHLCASAANGEELLRTARDLHPDVIVADVNIPFRDGLDVVSALRGAGLETPLVLTTTETRGAGPFLMRGAAGFVHKFDIHADLTEAVLLAAYGEQFISRSILREMH